MSTHATLPGCLGMQAAQQAPAGCCNTSPSPQSLTVWHWTFSQPVAGGGQLGQHAPSEVVGICPSSHWGIMHGSRLQVGDPPTLGMPATLLLPAVPVLPPIAATPPLELEPPLLGLPAVELVPP